MDSQTSKWVQADPGVPVIRNVNWGGLKTLYVKEVRRFFKSIGRAGGLHRRDGGRSVSGAS